MKNTETRRYQAEEYHKLAQEVLEIIEQLFPFSRCSVIRSYKNKESFGDMDILLCSKNLPSNWTQEIKDYFKPNESVKNGNCLSFDYKQLQIDVIVTKQEEFETSSNYYSYNDLGNIMGRISNSLGLKLGHDGLSYNFREGTNNYRNVVLSRDWKVVCDVLDLNYKRFTEGFDNLEGIFKFVVSSPFFNKEIFVLENRNHAARVRDKKRTTYTQFLKWIANDDNLLPKDYYYQRRNKEFYLSYLFDVIPHFKDTHKKVMQEWELDKKFKARYNGSIVSKLTGLSGKELGAFMQWNKAYYGEEGLKTIINTINPECIDDFILHNYFVSTMYCLKLS